MTSQKVVWIRCVIESTDNNIDNSAEFLPEAFHNTLNRRVDRANVAVDYYEGGVRLGGFAFERFGRPISSEMRRLMELEFDPPAATA